jgi:hypothetical protein
MKEVRDGGRPTKTPCVRPPSILRHHFFGFDDAMEVLMIFLHAGLSWLTLRTKHQ